MVYLPAEQFEEMCRQNCRHCAAGHVATRRVSTGEWVHTRSPVGMRDGVMASSMWSQTICGADEVRKRQELGEN